MADPFAGSGWSGGGGFNIPLPTYPAYKPVKVKKQDHGLVHNFLTDIRDATVGLPVGLYDTGKALGEAVTGNVHPLENIGKAVETYYKQTYGHGWQGFAASFHDHPLQPILDLAAVASLGGAVVGHGAELAARGAEMTGNLSKADAIRTSALGRTPESRVLDANPGMVTAKVGGIKKAVPVGAMPEGYRVYARNPVIRARQKLLDQMFQAAGESKLGAPLIGHSGSLRDMTDFGKQKRYLAKARGDRSVASFTMLKREGIAAKTMFKHGAPLDAIAGLLYPHAYDVTEKFAMPVSPAELAANKGKLADGLTFLAKKRSSPIPLNGMDPTLFAKYSRRLANSIKTAKKKDAATDAKGNYLVIRERSLADMQREAIGSHRALHALYNKPTQVWKWATLALSPRYFVNNVVGNAVMLAASHNPGSVAKSFYNVIREMHGERTAKRSMNHVGRSIEEVVANENLYKKWYTGATQGFSHDVTRDMKAAQSFKNPVVHGVVKYGQQGLYGVTHNVSDTFPRMIAIDTEIRKTALYRMLYRKHRRAGMSAKAAHRNAFNEASADPGTRYTVTHNVDNVLGDYHTFSSGENIVKRIVPFYSWDRAIMRHGASMVNERPAEAALLAQQSNQGVDQTKEFLGKHIPDFLKGVMPISDSAHEKLGFLGPFNPVPEGHAGRKTVMSTQGINPYSAIPDVTDLLGSLFHQSNGKGGETLSSQLNPILTGVIQHYTGTSLLSGKQMPNHGGLFHDVAQQTVEATPWARLAETVANGRPKAKVTLTSHGPVVKNPLLYRGDARQQIDSLVGAPFKQVSVKEANQLGRQELGIKLPKPAVFHPDEKITGFKTPRTKTRSSSRRSHHARRPTPHIGHVRRPRRKNYLPHVHF